MNYKSIIAKHQLSLSLDALIATAAHRAMTDLQLTALFVLHSPPQDPGLKLIRTLGCPFEPFVGNKKQFLDDIIAAIAAKTDKPHIHNIKDSAFANTVHRVANVPTPHRALFYPFEASNNFYLLLASLHPDQRNAYSDPLQLPSFNSLISLIHSAHVAETTAPQLTLTELFAKEVGHDIAIQVQTILSKLNLVSSGRYTGELALRKVREAEQEVLAAYRIADYLGVAVDRNYQLREKKDFDVMDAILSVYEQFSTEAAERHIQLRNGSSTKSISFFGDKRAFELAIGQIVMNGIKYGVGNSYITITADAKGDAITIDITGRSTISLPKDSPDKIFDFGWRTREAKELHVNGSGIGLFTVRKIVQAHLGDCTAMETPNGRIVTFRITLPSYARVRAELYQLGF